MTVDLRTRQDAEQVAVDPRRFFQETLPEKLHAHEAQIARGAAALPLRDLCIETEAESTTLAWEHGRVKLRSGPSGDARVRLTASQFTDIANDQLTPIALMSNALLDMPEGGLPDFLNWWLVLRAALDGRPIHVAGERLFDTTRVRSFTPEDSDEDMRAYLEEAGYLHIRGLFTKEEMAAVEADYPKAAPHFEKGDPRAWFAVTRDGDELLVRMEGFERYSPAATALLADPRLRRIAGISGCGHATTRRPGQLVGALTKPIGVVKGISDVPWHKDCSLGRHSYECCNVNVGISVTGADAQSGQLRVVPGSHRALVWPAPCLQPGLDLEPVDLPTVTGDVTVHLSCTLHMSQPPVTRTRKVLYTGFGLPPTDVAAFDANRRRLMELRAKTHTTVSQEPGHLGD